jgi:hypothetical protein
MLIKELLAVCGEERILGARVESKDKIVAVTNKRILSLEKDKNEKTNQ